MTQQPLICQHFGEIIGCLHLANSGQKPLTLSRFSLKYRLSVLTNFCMTIREVIDSAIEEFVEALLLLFLFLKELVKTSLFF